MLKQLDIQNYALIDHLSISFRQGFSVITGETGAGKSIILGAIGLLLGQRADSKAIKDTSRRCTIEAEFDLQGYGMETFFEENDLDFDGQECLIRREIAPTGKSRAFINDTPVQVAQLKALGEQLIDIHSQHQNLLLNKEDFQLGVVDILAGCRDRVSAYARLYADYRQALRHLEEARKEMEQARTDEEYLTFQLSQLDEADLRAGEQEELEQEARTLAHAEEIKEALFRTDSLLDGDESGALNALKEATRQLQSIAHVQPEAEELATRTESCYIELKDIAAEASSMADRVEFNPTRLEWVNDRLNTLYSLQQKHRVSDEATLIALAESLRSKLQAIEHGDEHLRDLEQACHTLHQQVLAEAAALTDIRRKASSRVEEEMQALLIPLGIPHVQFRVELTPRTEPDTSGMDKVNFLFSANKGGTLQLISEVASGGEIARVMLSLKALISGAVKLPTILFDEIDTGVSGQIAEKMGHIMQQMGAGGRQVLSITHLPQIAALGALHYKVYKEEGEADTTSHIVQLNSEERVKEIAHMLSGTTLTQAALDNARALLNP